MTMKICGAVVLALMCLTGLTSCGGNDGKTPAGPPRYSTAQAYISSLDFNGTALVKRGDVDILRAGFGVADKVNGVHNGIDTRFRIGSLTKAFTALAIVQLRKSNLIGSYDEPISNYITGYPRGDEITLRQLLNHTAGLPDYTALGIQNRTYTPAQLVNQFKNLDLEFTPGSRFRYSNSNYALLGYLIETISGMTYMDYLQSTLLLPLGMANTEYGASSIVGDPYAIGYDAGREDPAAFLDMSIPYAAGALSSNIVDMEIWAQSLLNGTLLSDQDREDLFTPGAASGEYGFGWQITQVAGKLCYHHTGAINGFSSVIALFPNERGIIVALSNVDGAFRQFDAMITTLAANEF